MKKIVWFVLTLALVLSACATESSAAYPTRQQCIELQDAIVTANENIHVYEMQVSIRLTYEILIAAKHNIAVTQVETPLSVIELTLPIRKVSGCTSLPLEDFQAKLDEVKRASLQYENAVEVEKAVIKALHDMESLEALTLEEYNAKIKAAIESVPVISK